MNDLRLVIYPALISILSILPATRAASPTPSGSQSSDASIEFFTAKEAGQISVRIIPQDARSGQVLITNNTAAPLTIKLPDAFAAVPILAQRPGVPGGGIVGADNPGRTQTLGGGIPNGRGPAGPGIGRGAFFNIGAQKVTKLKLMSVCLEYGKPEPTSRTPYEIVPISSITTDPAVIQLIAMLSRGEIEQFVAQAAAWHLANGLSWQDLRTKVGIKHIGGIFEPLFSLQSLHKAERAVLDANRRAGRSSTIDDSPGIAAQLAPQ